MLLGVAIAKNLSLFGTKFLNHYIHLLSELLKWIVHDSQM